jgi:ketosteroid isomerase-like protein
MSTVTSVAKCIFEVALMEQNFTTKDGQPTLVKQRSFSIFKKQTDGNWKFFRWIGQQ